MMRPKIWTADELVRDLPSFAEVEAVTAQIRPLLANKHPALQMAVLGDLVATFVKGHIPEARQDCLDTFGNMVVDLVAAGPDPHVHISREAGHG